MLKLTLWIFSKCVHVHFKIKWTAFLPEWLPRLNKISLLLTQGGKIRPKVSFCFFQHFTGNIEIIISIPHGGSLAPKSIPNRKCQCANKNHEKCPVVWVSDDLTIDLGLEIAKAIREHCGGDPHVVINHLWRSCHNSSFFLNNPRFIKAILYSKHVFHNYLRIFVVTKIREKYAGNSKVLVLLCASYGCEN